MTLTLHFVWACVPPSQPAIVYLKLFNTKSKCPPQKFWVSFKSRFCVTVSTTQPLFYSVRKCVVIWWEHILALVFISAMCSIWVLPFVLRPVSIFFWWVIGQTSSHMLLACSASPVGSGGINWWQCPLCVSRQGGDRTAWRHPKSPWVMRPLTEESLLLVLEFLAYSLSLMLHLFGWMTAALLNIRNSVVYLYWVFFVQAVGSVYKYETLSHGFIIINNISLPFLLLFL